MGSAAGSVFTSWRKHPWAGVFVAVAYIALVLVRRAALSPHLGAASVSAIWPASAVLATGLMLIPRRQQRQCMIATALGAALVTAIYGYPVRSFLGAGEGWMMAMLARRLCGPNPNFSVGRNLLIFLAAVVVPTSGLSTLIIFIANFPNHSMTTARVVQWFTGHGLGAAVFTPALITIFDRRRFETLRRSGRELALSLAALAGVTATMFFGQDPAMWFLVFPVVMLLAFRHGPLGSAGGTLIISLLALVRIYSGPDAGRFVEDVQWMQFFVVIVFLTTLPTAGAVASYARTRSLLARRTLTARAARRQAVGAAAAKGQFLANMSHEIRTPLNGVIGMADALSRTEFAPTQREMLKMILSSGEALTGLLSDALDLARADSGALTLAKAPFDVRQAVSEAAYLFESLAREKGLRFNVVFDLDPPGAAVGDALRIKQIVSNLISNAVKFTEAGSVTVAVSLKWIGDGGTLSVSVRDTGPGFDEEIRAKLFSRFEQGDSSVTRRYGGTGLGLAIAQTLATAMGGAIECWAVPDQGATFSLEIPIVLAEAAPERSPEKPRAPETVHARRLTVLLAEDNPVNQKVVQAMLDELVDLIIVPDGQAAVEAVARTAFDVILMDTHMPVMDGLTAIRRIRVEERRAGAPRTPVISLTADAMPQQVKVALEAGADLHVSKPITAERLIGALQQALRPPDAEVGAPDAGERAML